MSTRRDSNHWDRRDRKHQKKKFGMRVVGTSVRLLQQLIRRRAKPVRNTPKRNDDGT